MTVAKGIGGGFPLGACLATEAAAAGMTTGTHGSTYGGNPLACAVGCAVMDIVTAPGFLDQVSRLAGRFRQGLEGLVAAHPEVFEAVRGEGLMLGLKCRKPVAEVVQARLRRAGAGGAGGGERGAAPAGAQPDRGGGGGGAAPARRRGGGARGGGVRHFLDLHTTPAAELRAILGAAAAMKAARAGKPRGRAGCRAGAGRAGGGAGLREALDADAGQLRRGRAAARRRDDGALGQRDAARPRRDHRRHGAGAVALRRPGDDPHLRPGDAAGAGRPCHRCR